MPSPTKTEIAPEILAVLQRRPDFPCIHLHGDAAIGLCLPSLDKGEPDDNRRLNIEAAGILGLPPDQLH